MELKEAFIEYQKAVNEEIENIKIKLNSTDYGITAQTPFFKVTREDKENTEVSFTFPLEITKRYLFPKQNQEQSRQIDS